MGFTNILKNINLIERKEHQFRTKKVEFNALEVSIRNLMQFVQITEMLLRAFTIKNFHNNSVGFEGIRMQKSYLPLSKALTNRESILNQM